jgi:hypothetical protein
VQAQKSDILKREADLKAAVQKKLEGLQKQADNLGAGPAPEGRKAGVPARVGRVQLQGYAAEDEPKVLEVLETAGLRPGQVLRYPELEATRSRLEGLGFKRVEVIELPYEADTEFRDILVRGKK